MKNFQESLKKTIELLAGDIDKQNQEHYGYMTDMFKKELKIEDIEDFSVLFLHPIYDMVGLTIKGLYPNAKVHDLAFLFSHYSFLENHIEKVIVKKEGSACSVDKSRWLIRQMAQYYIDGAVFNMKTPTKCYWKPYFGTPEEWIEFIQALISLWYGNPDRYLKALVRFIKTEDKLIVIYIGEKDSLTETIDEEKLKDYFNELRTNGSNPAVEKITYEQFTRPVHFEIKDIEKYNEEHHFVYGHIENITQSERCPLFEIQRIKVGRI